MNPVSSSSVMKCDCLNMAPSASIRTPVLKSPTSTALRPVLALAYSMVRVQSSSLRFVPEIP